MNKMTNLERMEAFWSGQKPDAIPCSIYGWFGGDDAGDKPEWRGVFEKGLIPTYHVATFKSEWSDDIRQVVTNYEQNGVKWTRTAIQTPVGEVYSLHEAGWQQKYLLQTAEDYRVMTYIVEHTKISPNYERWELTANRGGGYGVQLAFTHRTPIQVILVDWAGLEQFSMHLFDFEDAVMELYHAQLKRYREIVNVVAGGPGKFVSCLENFTAETMGPQRFAQLHVPVYKELFPILHAAGKIVGTHYDGRLSSVARLVAESPIDLIESLTPPPEGDMTLTQCRQIWPDKLFWSNINVSSFELPPAQLKKLVLDRVQEGSVDGRLFAYEVSEDLPPNWQQSIPVVLEALEETRS